MHNMIVEDEHDEEDDFNYDQMGECVKPSHKKTSEFKKFIKNYLSIQDKKVHNQL
jgi:hypothetical protein